MKKVHVDLELLRAYSKVRSDGWEFIEWLQKDNLEEFNLSQNSRLSAVVASIRETLQNDGFVVVKFDVTQLEKSYAAFRTTQLLSLLGKPIRVFQNEPSHWRRVDVDLDRPENRSRGAGELALHMDFVNAEFPPDFVCLLCMTADPFGEGQSIISNFTHIENELSEKCVKLLKRPVFTDGRVENLSNIGSDANPFSVFPNVEKQFFRYTTNLTQNVWDAELLEALEQLNLKLRQRAITFILEAGELLIVDQRQVLHGRKPVGMGQETLAPSQRRLVLHSFIKDHQLP